MASHFKTILIPVDLSINTEVAIRKGLDLAEAGTTIHLLHVEQIIPQVRQVQQFLFNTQSTDREEVKSILEEWRSFIHEAAKDIRDIRVSVSIVRHASVQKAIERTVTELGADLVIIGKNAHHSWFPFLNTVLPSRLAVKTRVPILTVKPGSVHNKIRTVIVPIGSETPESKMELIATICRKFNVNVHLVTFMNSESPDDFNASSLLQVYQWLKTSVHCPVEYAVLKGTNKAKALLQYAGKTNADILLVHPETETKIGWWNKEISDALPAGSKVQVLAIQPAGVLLN